MFGATCHKCIQKSGRLHSLKFSGNQYLCVQSRCLNSQWFVEKQSQVQKLFFKHWNNFYTNYEEFVGLKDVQEAQLEVKKAEREFLKARAEERAVLRDVIAIRDQLKHVRERLSHVDYSNPLYPQLANEQHELVTQEEKMNNLMDSVEERERDSFLILSAAMRDSYEKERARVEKTKSWSLIGSVVGAIIGMIGSFYVNSMRTKDLKQMIQNRDDNEELQEHLSKVLPCVEDLYGDIKEEIKQLQVCLINKLLEPSSHHASTNEEPDMKAPETETVLKSINKVLQGLNSRLGSLQNEFAENHVLLTTQSDEIKNIGRKMEVLPNDFIPQYTSKVRAKDTSKPTIDNCRSAETTFEVAPNYTNIVKDVLVWGTAFTALYCMIRF